MLKPPSSSFGRRFAGAELDAPAAHQIERRDPFRDARRMIVSRRQQHDSVTEANLLGALAGSGQKNLGRRRMRVFFEKVMLDFPHVVDAELVGELDLIERILKQLQLRALLPRTRQLMLIKSSQLHLAISLPSDFFRVYCSRRFGRRRDLVGEIAFARPCRSLRACAARSSRARADSCSTAAGSSRRS